MNWFDHRLALKYLFLLYSQPNAFREKLESLTRQEMLRKALFLWLHAFPYIFVIFVLGRILIFQLVGFQVDDQQVGSLSPLRFHVYETLAGVVLGIGLGIVAGIAFGLASNFAGGIATGIATGIASGLAQGIVGGIDLNIPTGIVSSLLAGTALGISFGIALEVSGEVQKGVKGHPRNILGIIVGLFLGGLVMGMVTKNPIGISSGVALAIALVATIGTSTRRMKLRIKLGIGGAITLGVIGGIGRGVGTGIALESITAGIILGVALGIAITVSILRLYYYLYHLFFLWPTIQGPWYKRHPIIWDKACRITFPSLSFLLLDYIKTKPEKSKAEIERLIDQLAINHHVQARLVQVRLLLEDINNFHSLEELENIEEKTSKQKKKPLRGVKTLLEIKKEIDDFQSWSGNFNEWLGTKKELQGKISDFQRQSNAFHPFLIKGFQTAIAEVQKLVEKSSIPSYKYFHSGKHIKLGEYAFLKRKPIIEELISYITSGNVITLYGRRKVGKTTLLNNLQDSLPKAIMPVFYSMEDTSGFESPQDIFTRIKDSVIGNEYLKEFLENTQTIKNFQGKLIKNSAEFYDFLENLDKELKMAKKRVLFMLDEYEWINQLTGKLPEELPVRINQSTQSHSNITWIFAGGHKITEFKEVPLGKSLITAKTIEIPFFTLEETKRLLTDPFYEKGYPNRPKLESKFGPDVITQIYENTFGWPILVQMVAEEALKNIQDDQEITTQKLEEVFGTVVYRGTDFFTHVLETDESKVPGAGEYLYGFGNKSIQPPPDDEKLRESLQRRKLVYISEDEERWSLRVPLMERWLRKKKEKTSRKPRK